jgi:biopolymer transport protein ExbD
MRFFIRKRNKPPTVIIVALIDVLIVLLIFLMVTTTFKQRPALKLALPESNQATKTGANEAAPLVIAINDKGSLGLGVEAKAVTMDRLKAELLERVGKNPQLKLAISADKNAPFGQIVKVMDAAKEAGIKSVNAFTKEAAKP